MSNEYPPSGVLFTNNRKEKSTQPDYTGHIELSDEVVNDLVSQMAEGNTKPKIDLAGWKRTSQKNGATFLSLVGSVHYARRSDGQSKSQSTINDEVPF